jgi:hypothetical protein
MNFVFHYLSAAAASSLMGIVLKGFFSLFSRRRSGISYQHQNVRLSGGDKARPPAEVEIRFSGKSVPGVTASTLALWKRGAGTIDGTAIVKKDPLRIEAPDDCEILKFETIQTTRQVNGWHLELSSPRCLLVTFDYIDSGDGAIVQLLYSKPTGDVAVLGTIKGIPNCLRDEGTTLLPINGLGNRRGTLDLIVTIGGLAIALFSLLVCPSARPQGG